jgi:hypothetical protein
MKTVEIIGHVMAHRLGKLVEMSDYKADILIKEGKAKLANKLDTKEEKVKNISKK